MMTVPEMSASPSREEVLQALERLLSSRRFIRAGRHSRLLRYVVEETLNGKGPQLKESLLGIEVFGRPAGCSNFRAAATCRASGTASCWRGFRP